MSLNLLSHPFRMKLDGTVATVEQGSEAYNAEQLAMYIMTIRGERRLVPGFGLRDPIFDQFEEGEVSTGIAMYGPPDVTIQSVDISSPNKDGIVQIQLQANL